MNRMIGMVAALLGGASCACAGTLTGMQAWAGRSGTNVVALSFFAHGITNPVDCAAITADWDEDLLVETSLRERAYGTIAFAMGRDKFAPATVERVKAAVLAETVPPAEVLDVVARFPVAEREQFRTVVVAAGAVRYARQPEYGRLFVKYGVLQGRSISGPDVGEDELLRCLLAPEGLTLTAAESFKKAIKERAVTLARTKLRAEGKSFVVKSGVNPLVVMVQPVVTALNAPECAGVEAALRDLGSTVQDIDRKVLRELVAAWQPRMMSGEMGPAEVNQVLGKIAVALGPDAYNRFVDAYNNGTSGGK